MVVSGKLTHELELNAPATEVWEVYGTLKLAKLVEENLDMIEKIEIVEGDGGVGTVLQLRFVPGTRIASSYKEKFTMINNDKRVKEVEVIEGGYLDYGFTSYLVRLEIIENGKTSSIIKSTIEYSINEEDAANASFVTIHPFANIAHIVKTHVAHNKSA